MFSYPSYPSDHAAIILNTEARCWTDIDEKAFKLEPIWFAHEDCMKVLESTWQNCHNKEPWVQIGRCVEALKAWSRDNFGNIKKEIRATKQLLKKFQKQVPSADSLKSANS